MKAMKNARVVMVAGHKAGFDADVQLSELPRRDLESIPEAAGRVEQAADRLHHALFWFWEHTDLDRQGMAMCREGNHMAAIQIWEQAISQPMLVAESASTQKNLRCFTSTWACASSRSTRVT